MMMFIGLEKTYGQRKELSDLFQIGLKFEK